MPHCIIEYSESLSGFVSPEQLIQSVYQGAVQSQLFLAEDIKVRAMPYHHYTIGSSKSDFVHVTLKILSGRSGEQRHRLSKEVLRSIQSLPIVHASFTVEVLEIERETYSKLVR